MLFRSVSTVLVKEGQRVASGTPLIRFDQRDAQAKLQAATAIRNRSTVMSSKARGGSGT